MAQRLFDAGVEVLVQAVDDVAALVYLAALDGGGDGKSVADRL
jgi:hypothetical protein